MKLEDLSIRQDINIRKLDKYRITDFEKATQEISEIMYEFIPKERWDEFMEKVKIIQNKIPAK
jgi:hypothetical protein